MADVVYAIVDKITSDDKEMTRLLNIYMNGLKRSREVHAVQYRDFGKYKLVKYDREFHPQLGDTIVVTMLDQRNDGNQPRDFDMKVIQLEDGETPGIGETGNMNIGFMDDCIKSIDAHD